MNGHQTLSDDLALSTDLLAMSDDEIREFISAYGLDLRISTGEDCSCNIVRGPRSITLTFSEPCMRCGGAGGWKGWPGYTCFRCGSHAPETHESRKFSLTKVLRERCQKIKNEKAGKGRYTNAALKKQARAEAQIAQRDKMIADAGIDPKRYFSASDMAHSWCEEWADGRTLCGSYETMKRDNPNCSGKNPDYSRSRRGLIGGLANTAGSIMRRVKFGLSEKQVDLVNEFIEKVENIEQIEADIRAEAGVGFDEWYGTEGERLDIESLTVVKSIYVESNWGGSRLIILRTPEGHILKTFYGGNDDAAGGLMEGDTLDLRATIKKHENSGEYDDHKTTMLNRIAAKNIVKAD